MIFSSCNFHSGTNMTTFFLIKIIQYFIHVYRRYGRSTRPLMVAHTTIITSASSQAGKNQTTWNPRQRWKFTSCLSKHYLKKRSWFQANHVSFVMTLTLAVWNGDICRSKNQEWVVDKIISNESGLYWEG